MFEGLVAADAKLDDAQRAVVEGYLRDLIAAMRVLL
jgi:hypothetical protein